MSFSCSGEGEVSLLKLKGLNVNELRFDAVSPSVSPAVSAATSAGVAVGGAS